jgi:hypothetical protein
LAAPLNSASRDALVALFEMRWGGAEPEVSAADWKAFRDLCSPTSPDFILSCPDYYAFFTESLFCGRVAG